MLKNICAYFERYIYSTIVVSSIQTNVIVVQRYKTYWFFDRKKNAATNYMLSLSKNFFLSLAKFIYFVSFASGFFTGSGAEDSSSQFLRSYLVSTLLLRNLLPVERVCGSQPAQGRVQKPYISVLQRYLH